MDWTRHLDPEGFVVSHPVGWTVATAEHLVMVRSADRSAFCLIHPFQPARPISAAAWLQKSPTLLQPLLPQLQIQQARSCRTQPDEVIAQAFFLQNGIPGQAALLCSLCGQSGMLFGIASPQAQFAALKPTLIQILESFSFTQAADQNAPSADPAFVRWNDPREYAFSLDVPQGWQVNGGMFRAGPVDTRIAVEIVSPDGQVRVTAGDADIPPFTEPNSMLLFAGLTEGSWYSPGYGTQMMIMRYTPGTQFAGRHVENRIVPRGANLHFTEQRDRPDLAQLSNAQNAQMAAFAHMVTTVGDVAFTYQLSGQPMRGYYLAGTQRNQMIGMEGALWYVILLYGYVAPPSRLAEAQAVLDRMVQSFQYNLQWQAAQGQTAVTTSQIVSQTNAAISKTINDSYWQRLAVMDDIARKRSNTILGLTDVIDPATGESWKVTYGHNYYWRQAGTNVVVGTDTYDRPDINFEPLNEW